MCLHVYVCVGIGIGDGAKIRRKNIFWAIIMQYSGIFRAKIM